MASLRSRRAVCVRAQGQRGLPVCALPEEEEAVKKLEAELDNEDCEEDIVEDVHEEAEPLLLQRAAENVQRQHAACNDNGRHAAT